MGIENNQDIHGSEQAAETPWQQMNGNRCVTDYFLSHSLLQSKLGPRPREEPRQLWPGTVCGATRVGPEWGAWLLGQEEMLVCALLSTVRAACPLLPRQLLSTEMLYSGAPGTPSQVIQEDFPKKLPASPPFSSGRTHSSSQRSP